MTNSENVLGGTLLANRQYRDSPSWSLYRSIGSCALSVTTSRECPLGDGEESHSLVKEAEKLSKNCKIIGKRAKRARHL